MYEQRVRIFKLGWWSVRSCGRLPRPIGYWCVRMQKQRKKTIVDWYSDLIDWSLHDRTIGEMVGRTRECVGKHRRAMGKASLPEGGSILKRRATHRRGLKNLTKVKAGVILFHDADTTDRHEGETNPTSGPRPPFGRSVDGENHQTQSCALNKNGAEESGW